MGASQSARCLGALDEPEKKLKAPGQYERLHDDAKRVTAVNTFEGAKFEVAKPLTPTFALNHNFWLGGSYYPNANQHYKFGATGKFIFNLPKDPKGFVAVLDADYGGATHSAQLKVAQNIHGVAGPHCGCAYMQAVTPRWSLGGEGACALAGPSAAASRGTRARSGGGGDAAGAEFALKQSRVNVAVDGNGKMASVVETQLSPAAKLTFSADMQLGYNDAEPGKHRDHFKFGYALQIGQ
ncbi:hypothetical protein JL720_13290 [Aureococcus anophagefferens]|nr:hypothetical protein JL720_13290 [Aureococcus anophagefferens]